MKQLLFILCTLASTLCVAGCMVGPRYQRPVTNAAQVFRGATAPDINSREHPQVVSVQGLMDEQAGVTSLGDEKWAAVFKDPTLQQLIGEALANNYDAKIAAQRVLEQQDQVGITRAQQFPTVTGGWSYTSPGLPSGLGTRLKSSGNGHGYTPSNVFAGGV